MKKSLSFVLALALLLLVSCGGGGAATMHLRKTEGTVGVADGEGKDISPKDNLGLYSGYQVETQEESYAWIDLDNVKLTKMDAESEIEITKDGKKLEIEVKSGSLFFNVTEPLSDDESMMIRTSTMMIGIRGTCGWVVLSDEGDTLTVYLLEGEVECSNEDNTAAVSAGEKGTIPASGEITVTAFTAISVPEFVRVELEDNETLAEAVKAASGLDVLNPPPANELAHTAYDRVLSEFREVHSLGLDIGWWSEAVLNAGAEPPPESAYQAYQFLNVSGMQNYSWPSHYAYYDIDGNGTDELITVSVTDWYATCCDVYAFDGSGPVLLTDIPENPGSSLSSSFGLTTDGAFVRYVGNGGRVVGVYRLDGFTLEPVDDSPFLDTWGTLPAEQDLVVSNSLELIPLY